MKNLFKKDKNTETAEGSAENGSATKSKLKLDKRMILIICAACLAVVCVVLAIVLPICLTGDGDYYTLKYDGSNPDGVNIVIKNSDGADVKNGWEVKSGVNVQFTLEYEAEHEGEPIVFVNDREVKANAEGVYSFTMNSNVNIRITGVVVMKDYQVTFDGGQDGWIRYSSEAYDVSNPITVRGGNQVTFDVSISVYYKQEGYTVVANTVVVNPDENGHYTFTVIGNTTVSVRNLVQDDPFSARYDEATDSYHFDGDGTIDHPYKIRKPIDLYAMADLIGDSFYQGSNFQAAYYELANDIDMQGERLYIIGDYTTEISFFGGNFNGNGHTISNYRIADTLVEQEGFTDVFTPYLGLFGVVSATSLGPASIYDLNLKDFTIEITHTNRSGFFAGGLIGMGVGVNVTNCTVDGKILADADPDWSCVMGGMAGQLRSVATGTLSVPSYLRSCSSNAEVGGRSGFIQSAGGLVGHLISFDAVTPAYVLNSYSTGDVYGAVRTGGIAGSVSAFSSIKNCYSTGEIDARTTESRPGMDDYFHAYAGGIAGHVDYGAVISDCFSVAETYASASSSFPASYAVTDGIAAYVYTEGELPAGAYHALVLNSYSTEAGDAINASLIKDTLKWNEGDWVISTQTGEYPLINQEEGHVTYTLTVNFVAGGTVNGNITYTVTFTDLYSDMAGLYGGVFVENRIVTLPQYFNADTAGYRTYGYYFDSEFEKRIPYSYVPTGDMTIYAEFVNYNDVAGTYYIQNGVNGSASFVNYKNLAGNYSLTTPFAKNAYIRLDKEGNLTYRNGVIANESVYYYDGNNITLEQVYVYTEEYNTGATDPETNASIIDLNSYYITLNAELNSGNLDIYDGEAYKTTHLKAVKEISDFTYGYYYRDNVTYLFNPDMTGEKTTGTITTGFTYSVSGTTVTAGSEILTIGSGANDIKAYDVYYGTWEKSAGSNKQYTFDGKGGYTYEEFGYANGNKTIYTTTSGNVSGLSLSIENDLLIIGGETYYKQNSFAGSWYFPDARENGLPVNVTFGGISALGYGSAVVDYGEYYGTLTLGYHAITDADTVMIELYSGDFLYGRLEYVPAEKILTGNIISPSASTNGQPTMVNNATFFFLDDFKGSWVSNESGFELINFNGLGNYDVEGTSSHAPAVGEIKINGESAGAYTLVSGKLEGSFTYGGVNYTLVYNETSKVVKVTGGGKNVELVGFDGWERITLVTADGTTYEFNGAGKAAGGGKVTVTTNGTPAESTYTVNGSGMPVIGGNTLAIADGKYTLGTTDLWLKTDFTGKWKYKLEIGENEYGKTEYELDELEIFNVGPRLGGGYKVGVRYDGGEGSNDAVYDLDRNEIYFINEATGYEFNIRALKSESETSLSFMLLNKNRVYSYICVSALDDYAGEYVNGNGGKIVFDGFGVSVFATGEAVEYDALGRVVKTYNYTEEDGELKLSTTKLTSGTGIIIDNYVFKEVAAVDEAYEMNGKHYRIVEVDDLYGATAYQKVAQGNVNKNIIYEFDGVGGIIATDANGAYVASYNYDPKKTRYSTLLLTYTLYVTDDDGRIYAGELSFSSDTTLRLTEKDRFYGLEVYGVDKDGKVDKNVMYVFDGLNTGDLLLVQGADATTYNYKLLEDKGETATFEVTIPSDDSKKFLGVLTFGKGVITFTLTEVTTQ